MFYFAQNFSMAKKQHKPTLGEKLKQFRENEQLTLRTLQEVTGISNAYLSQLENDKIKKPSADILYKLAEVYKIDFSYLMSLAGIVENEALANKSFGEFVFSKNNLTPREEDELLQYLKFIRARDKKN